MMIGIDNSWNIFFNENMHILIIKCMKPVIITIKISSAIACYSTLLAILLFFVDICIASCTTTVNIVINEKG